MLRKRGIIALLGVSLVATWPMAASATSCPPRNPPYTHVHKSIGGSTVTQCTLTKTGSVTDEIQQNKINPKAGLALGAVNVPQPETNLNAGHALLLCGTPGNNNLSPGIQVREISATVGAFSAFQNVTKSDGLGGTTYGVQVTASPLNPEEPNFVQYFSALKSKCPNNNWTPLDYVPCDVIVQVQRKENGSTTIQSDLFCTLEPNCATLGHNETTRKFDARFYDCTEL